MQIDWNYDDPENSVKFGLLNIKDLMRDALYEAKKHFDKCCPYCKGDLSVGMRGAEFDHFIPIAKGGQDFPWNILPVCSECNRKKKDKMPYEFLDENKYKKCKDYLNSVLIKYTKQHEDYLQIASQVENFVKQHRSERINDKELIRNLYQILGFEIKEKEEKPIEIQQVKTGGIIRNEHIQLFWNALAFETRRRGYENQDLYLKENRGLRKIFVHLKKSYPIYVSYCQQKNIASRSSYRLSSIE